MTNWKEHKLSDLMQIKYGKDHKHLADGSYPLYGSGGIMRYVEKPFYEDESILIPRKGTLSNLCCLNEPFWSGDTMFWSIINKDLALPKYLYYTLKTFDLASLNVGSAVPSLTTQVLNEVLVSVPDLPTQTAIAEILSSLDDKIELNNKINQELENLAQTLFKQWFIDFEFPANLADSTLSGVEGYKSSGGALVDSKLGEIPKGWEVGSFGDLCELSTGKGIKKKDYLPDGLFPVIGANGIMGFYDKFNTEGFKILTGRVGTLGTVRINTERVWTSDNVIVCSPKSEELNHFAFHILTNFNFNALNRGSTQPLLTQTDLKSQEIIIPLFNVLNDFNFQLESMYSIFSINIKENQELTHLRDTLLPKLISGELKVEEPMAEKA